MQRYTIIEIYKDLVQNFSVKYIVQKKDRVT